MADPTISQPATGLGSVAETNRLLGKTAFNPDGSAVTTPVAPVVPVNPHDAPGYNPATDPTSSAYNNGLTSSSNTTVAGENKTSADVAALTALGQQQAADNVAYQAQLEARRQSDIATINSSFDATKNDTVNAQTRETGATSVSLARIGGYLGNSASGTGAMINLNQTHQNQLSALEVKRAAAVQAANTAIDDKQFALAKAKTDEARAILNDIQSAKTTFFNQNLALLQEQRANNTSLQTQAKNVLDVVSTTGVLNPDQQTQIDNVYGAGTGKAYVDIVNADKAAKSEKAMYDSASAKIDFLSKIPKGVPVQFGNETLTGLGAAGDIQLIQSENKDTGVVTVVSYDKRNGTYTKQSVGSIGTPNSGDNTIKLSSTDKASIGSFLTTDEGGKNQVKQWLMTPEEKKQYDAAPSQPQKDAILSKIAPPTHEEMTGILNKLYSDPVSAYSILNYANTKYKMPAFLPTN